MNVNPDLPTTLEVEDAATDSQPAKPVRRKRAAPVKADEAAATVALDDAAPVAAEPAEAAPKPARRRRSVAPQGESVVEVLVEATTPALAPPLFSLAVEPERIETAPAEFAPVVESVEPSPERVVAEGSESMQRGDAVPVVVQLRDEPIDLVLSHGDARTETTQEQCREAAHRARA